jgi:hypothetical protein
MEKSHVAATGLQRMKVTAVHEAAEETTRSASIQRHILAIREPSAR